MPAQLRAFISRSFAPDDRDVTQSILGLIRGCADHIGVTFHDLEEHVGCGHLRHNVREDIRQSDFLLCIATLRDGGVPGWIDREVCWALEEGKKVVLFRETGLPPDALASRFPVLASVEFDRNNLFPAGGRMISHFMSTVEQVRESPDQIIREMMIEVPVRGAAHGRSYEIAVRELREGRPTELTWNTFSQGMQALDVQIERHTPRLQFDLMIGVNSAGAIMAAYLDGRRRDDERPLGIIKSSSPKPPDDRRHVYYSLRKMRGVSSILVVDSLLKSGNSLRVIREELRTRYETAQVYYAALVACGVGIQDFRRCKKIGEFFDESANTTFTAGPDFVPDFLAFVTRREAHVPGDLH